MDNANIIANYVKKPITGNRAGVYYIDVQQEEYELNTATLDETAELIDEIFNTSLCDEEEVVEEEQGEPLTLEDLAVKYDEFLALAKDFLAGTSNLGVCSLSNTADFECFIRIYLSDWDEDYKLRFTNGDIVEGSEEHKTEQISEQYSVQKASYVKLQIPSTEKIEEGEEQNKYTWISCIPLDGQGVPAIYCNGAELYWDGDCTGTIQADYKAEYDRKQIIVYGTNGEMGDCTVIGFYHGLIDKEDIEQPEEEDLTELEREKYCDLKKQLEVPTYPAECYQIVNVREKCNCSQATSNTYEYEEVVSCPEGVDCGSTPECRRFLGYKSKEVWVDCGESDFVSLPEFYEDRCCEYPEVSLPSCSVKRSSNYGSGDLSDELKQEYYEKYGAENVQFIRVMPEDGCGDLITRQIIPGGDCCDGVSVIEYNDALSPDVLPRGENILVHWSGGKTPYTVKVSDIDTYIGGEGIREAITSNPYIRIFANDEFCGATILTIDDGCSTINVYIRADEGRWILIAEDDAIPPEYESKFSGKLAENVGGLIWQAVSRNYKLVETIDIEYWPGGDIQCDGSGLYTPAPGYEDKCISLDGGCNAWYCERIREARPETAIMENWLSYNWWDLISPPYDIIFCYYEDGAIATRSSYSTSYYCLWTSGGSGSGSKLDEVGYYLKITDRKLYEWVC